MEANMHDHWEQVYQTKNPDQVSWTQEYPTTSMEFIQSFHLPKDAAIIDIGGGDSKLADCLLEAGFTNITVLDISATALEKAKRRLGDRAKKITWIVSDINSFQPQQPYDLWHDRAAFHFLTRPDQIDRYIHTAAAATYLTLGTFSVEGPQKCSGLPIRQYDETLLGDLLEQYFKKIRCITEDHTTPFNTTQNFLFCSFKNMSH